MNTDPHAARLAELESGGPGGHASHDELLIVRFTGADVTPEEAGLARSLLSTCPTCRQLADDLLTIARATADLPAPMRTRDLRISEEQAARLRPGGPGRWLRRVVGLLRPAETEAPGRRGVALQRLAAAAVAIGLVMAVVTSPAVAPLASPESGGAFGQAAALPAPTAGPAFSAGPASDQAPLLGGAAVTASAVPAASAERVAVPRAPSPAAPPSPVFALGPVGASPPAAGVLSQPTVGASAGAEKGATTGTGTGSGVSAGEAPTTQAAGGLSPAGRQAAGGRTIETWQVWLLVAAAGLVAFAALRVAVSRTP